MFMKFKKTLFIFRRDLRLEDNSGLLEALENSEKVIPVFVFDKEQVDTKKNKYFGENSFQFMANSLKELDEDLKNRGSKLYVFEGQYEKIIDQIIKDQKVDAVYVNKDFTPFARKRDGKIKEVCDKNDALFFRIDDYTLSPIEIIKTGNGDPYSVFTPFMKNASTHRVAASRKNNFNNYFSGNLKSSSLKSQVSSSSNLMIKGGRKEALNLMKRDIVKSYAKNRDLPDIDGTSRLSAHIKFGTVSIREVYEWGNKSQTFISELYWRDFYLHIAYFFPKVFGKSFQDRGDKIKWINDKKQFKSWCEGKTGVPIVDAGMRQLNTIGWMHNRVRMIVASYLTKNLLIDWRWGEKYFAQKLIDYDPSSNNGGWQWSASVGADTRPIRIFNPYTQTQKFDKDAKYIKEWVKELKDVETDKLTNGKEIDFSKFAKYPSPLVDQKESFHRAMKAYKKAKN